MAKKIKDEHGNVYITKETILQANLVIVLVGLFVIGGLQSVLGGGGHSSTSSSQATSTTTQTTTEASASSSEEQKEATTYSIGQEVPVGTLFTLSIQKRLPLT